MPALLNAMYDTALRTPERLKLVLDLAPVAFTVFSANDLRIVDHNAATLGFVAPEARAAGTLVGMRAGDLLEPPSGAALEGILRQALARRQSISVPEFTAVLWPAGELRYFRGTVTPLLDAEDNVRFLMTSSIDITDEVLARERVRELAAAAEARAHELEVVISSMTDGVLITDAHSRAVLSNPALDALIGRVVPGEDSTERVRCLAPRARNGRSLAEREGPVRRALAGERYSGAEYVISVDNTPERYVRASGAPLCNAEGELIGAVVVLRDVTAAVTAELERDQFLSLISHELRTPVTIIRGFAQMLKRPGTGSDTETLRRRLDIIERQADQLAGLINEMLDLSRVQSGHLGCRMDHLDYRALIEVVLDEMRSLHPQHEFRLSAPDVVSVLGDHNRLQQVLVNLMDNAIMHGPAGTAVTVTVECADGQVTTYVCDEGPSLPAAERERIFERFYRLSPDSPRAVGSLGLGLYISRGIVEAHGGRIWVTDDDHSSYAFSLHAPSAPAVTRGL